METTAPETRMPLLCLLGWHQRRTEARWNNGYYFTRCARCGSDLVRTAYGRWHEPRGARVVWQAEPPPNVLSAELVSETGEPAEVEGDELPIQEVLRHLQNGDAEAEAPVVSPEVAPAAIPAPPPAPADMHGRPASRIPDFMGEATRQSQWETRPRSYLLKAAPAALPAADADAAPAGPGIFERLNEGFDRFLERGQEVALGLFGRVSGFFRRLGSETDPAPVDEAPAPAEPEAPTRADEAEAEPEDTSPIRFGLFVGLAIALAVALALIWQGGNASGPTETEAENSLRIPVRGQSAFVTASLLNCRNAPALEADTVGTLMRGDTVELLDRDGEWVSLVVEGGQCWALARYFSVAQPL